MTGVRLTVPPPPPSHIFTEEAISLYEISPALHVICYVLCVPYHLKYFSLFFLCSAKVTA